MKTASQDLLDLLATGQFFSADLYSFTLVGGTVLRYTSFDVDVVADGDVVELADATLAADFVEFGDRYSCGGVAAGPYFERAGEHGKVRLRVGLEVDTLEFSVLPGTAEILGSPFVQAVLAGLFDGAEFQLERAVMPSPGDTSAGTVIMFTGMVGQVVTGRAGGVTFTINSHLELLAQKLPKNLYQSGCIWTLYDAGCALSSTAFQQSGALAAGSGQLVLNVSLPQATGKFDLGKITMTSGVCSGQVRSIRGYVKGTPGTMTLLSPLPAMPATGDTFTAVFGCNKKKAVCDGTFNNLDHFRAFPFIPTPETAL